MDLPCTGAKPQRRKMSLQMQTFLNETDNIYKEKWSVLKETSMMPQDHKGIQKVHKEMQNVLNKTQNVIKKDK